MRGDEVNDGNDDDGLDDGDRVVVVAAVAGLKVEVDVEVKVEVGTGQDILLHRAAVRPAHDDVSFPKLGTFY